MESSLGPQAGYWCQTLHDYNWLHVGSCQLLVPESHKHIAVIPTLICENNYISNMTYCRQVCVFVLPTHNRHTAGVAAAAADAAVASMHMSTP